MSVLFVVDLWKRMSVPAYAGGWERLRYRPRRRPEMERAPVKNLTRPEVEELRESLNHVPKTRRGESWQKATRFLEHILQDGSNLAIRTFADDLHYSVSCTICKRLIAVGSQFCSMDDGYRHYDCNLARSEEPR